MTQSMKRWMLAAVIALVLLITPTVSATVEPGVTTNPCDHGFIDFEEGTDGTVIRSTIPGVKFTTTEGQDWIYGDWRTGTYNGKYPDGSYTSNGDLWAWLGPNQGYGRIDFTEGTGTYISFLTSTASGVTVDAYDSNGNLLASSGWAGGNINTGKMTRLNVSAPGMAYVLIHDSGNYWLIDDICTDAHGVRGVNLDIYTDKAIYYPDEEIVINTRVTDAYGSCLHPLSKNNFDIFIDETEVNSEDIVFEELSCSNYNLKINAPLATGDYSIEVVVDTTPGTESASLSISVAVIDSDTDGLPDYEEDKDHDGVVDLDETDPNDHDTDEDGINDNIDPYPWRTENRKALVVGITEYDFFALPFQKKLYPDWPKWMGGAFNALGFDVTMHIDENPHDGNVITYDDVTKDVTNFVNTLNSDDVAAVYIDSHGQDFRGRYFLAYGDGLVPEDALFPGDTEHITGQLDDIGTYLDFLWLYTCHSWAYRDKVENLGAGGIIFFGADGDTYPAGQDDFYDAIIAERYVENSIDNLQHKNFRMVDQYPSMDQNSGNMDLMNPLLTHRSPVVHLPEPEESTQTQNETFASVNYIILDSDGDGFNDTVTVSWDVNTVFPQDNVTVFAHVHNSSHRIADQYIYGPYTIYGNSHEISSFNFYSTSTDTYNIKLMLYDSFLNGVDFAFINDLSLNTGTGGPGGEEKFTNIWFDSSDSNGNGVDDTINISWNVDTTLPQEDVSVLITVRDSILKYGPYTIYNSLPNAGAMEFYVGDIGAYEVTLHLVDSNSEFEDSASVEVPIGVSRFTDTYSDYGTDMDGDGQYDYLTINVGMDVTSAGNCTLHGSLYHEGESIDTVSNDLYLNEGIQTVQLNFDGQTLYKSGIDGQYELRYLVLYSNGAFIGHRDRAYTTTAYDHTQFQAPIILFNTFDDHGVDTNSNGLFEYLIIETNVDVAIAGNYIISGYLYDNTEDFIVSASNYTYLDIGQQTVQLNFDGHAIT